MTARELLRSVADDCAGAAKVNRLDILGTMVGNNSHRIADLEDKIAGQLRALADRIDAEESTAVTLCAGGDIDRAGVTAAVLARLDAELT